MVAANYLDSLVLPEIKTNIFDFAELSKFPVQVDLLRVVIDPADVNDTSLFYRPTLQAENIVFSFFHCSVDNISQTFVFPQVTAITIRRRPLNVYANPRFNS